MAGILTQAHMQRLEALRRVNLELQGEPGSISLQKLDPNTREFVDFLTIDRSFYLYLTEGADGRSLPPDVQFELQIGELMITDEDARQVAAVQHGGQRYRVVRGDQAEPGMLPPTGPRRYWRFHIAPLEETQ
jgi:hypothetical protein